jgi:hypothetical protein
MNKYKNIDKIKPETLLGLVREVLDQSSSFIYISGTQPFLMSFNNQKYYVYVKNISSAYFSDRDKTTRAQLPIKPEFDSIKASPHAFIFLGYDGINDVFVCWNYHIAKERLNIGKSVSFYSRTYFQSEVKEGEFIRRQLKNGDLPVLFKRSNLIAFFEQINTFFPNIKVSNLNFEVEFCKFNYEEKFIEYLKIKRKLSDKTIKNYINALRNRISLGLKKYFIPSLETIFFINNKSVLDNLNTQLFETKEFRELNIIGKNMYSCAFDNYINFIKDLDTYESNENSNKVNENQEEYSKNGKLLKITNLDLLNQLKPFIEANRLLSAAQIVGNYYKGEYLKMELSDWINLVRKINN